MHIDVHDDMTLQSIRETIGNFYPYLDIAFFKKTHKRYESCSPQDQWTNNHTIAQIRKTHFSGIIEIQPWYKVADVERAFMEKMGISVQILRKENAKWEQTTGMDDLTLRQLNIMGRNSDDNYIMADWDVDNDDEGRI